MTTNLLVTPTSLNDTNSTSHLIYTTHLCVCVLCVRGRERERERDRDRKRVAVHKDIKRKEKKKRREEKITFLSKRYKMYSQESFPQKVHASVKNTMVAQSISTFMLPLSISM